MHQCHRTVLGLAIFATTGSLYGQSCRRDYIPFEYGSDVVQIVLDHYTARDPIVAAPYDYARAATDVGLIRTLIPALAAAVPHSPTYVPNELLIETLSPDDPDLVCLNAYYAGEMLPIDDDSWIIYFPQPVNLLALKAIYEQLPVVLSGYFDLYGCAGSCCSSTWSYDSLADGTWRWELQVDSPWIHGACFGSTWALTVTIDGVVTLEPDLNIDDVVDAEDLAILLDSWGACPAALGGYCPADFDLSHAVDGADLVTLLSKWS